MTNEHEPIQWRVSAHIDKYDPDQVDYALAITGARSLTGDELASIVGKPADTYDSDGNMLLTAGLNRLTSLMIAGGGQALTATACRIGAGDSVTAEALGQTDLQAAAGSTHRWFQVMDATYPQQANGVLTFRSTFGTADGNFVWAEWGIDVGAPTVTSGNTVNALLLNRKVAAQGTKVAGAIWTPTITITIA